MKQERRVSQRRQSAGDRRRDALGEALGGITKADMHGALQVSDARIEIRCPSPVKAEMEAIAGRYGLTLTDYLLRLHAVARERLGKAD